MRAGIRWQIPCDSSLGGSVTLNLFLLFGFGQQAQTECAGCQFPHLTVTRSVHHIPAGCCVCFCVQSEKKSRGVQRLHLGCTLGKQPRVHSVTTTSNHDSIVGLVLSQTLWVCILLNAHKSHIILRFSFLSCISLIEGLNKGSEIAWLIFYVIVFE